MKRRLAWLAAVTAVLLVTVGCRRVALTDTDHPGPAACKWCTRPVGDPGMLECDDCLAGRGPQGIVDDAYDDDGCDDQDADCTRCGGDGLDECGDPIQCCQPLCDGDIHPCGACGGTGNASEQTVW